ncbi:hypothetical protein KY284_032762 [Solanum tuberosum]|nr:hypothetical protein KY284_032762 [Solanum tuberosum]
MQEITVKLFLLVPLLLLEALVVHVSIVGAVVTEHLNALTKGTTRSIGCLIILASSEDKGVLSICDTYEQQQDPRLFPPESTIPSKLHMALPMIN